MKVIILAAGYATRLYPLTKNKAKPLLTVGSKTILDHIVEKVDRIEAVDELFIVTNDKFYESFADWASTYRGGKTVTVVNDLTTTNENRIGAIADIQFVIDRHQIEDDVMVLAGDNLFDFELTEFVHFFKRVNSDCITVHELTDRTELQRTGVVQVDEHDTVISFEEKPAEPKSNLAVPPFYLYKKETLPLFKQYLNEGNNPDAPGNFIPWLIGKKQVKAYQFAGNRYDIGTVESYERVQKQFVH